MLTQPELTTGLQLPNTLTPSSAHATAVISHFMSKLYGDMLAEAIPQRLQALIAKLEAADTVKAGAS
jgi:hypothetical protein